MGRRSGRSTRPTIAAEKGSDVHAEGVTPPETDQDFAAHSRSETDFAKRVRTCHTINPDAVATPAELNKSLVLVDLHPDSADDNSLSLTLKVVFGSVVFTKRGGTRDRFFFAATEGGRILANVNKGSVVDHTPAAQIDVQYDATQEVSQATNFKLSVQPGNGAVGGSTAEYSFDRGAKYNYRSSFTARESLLEPQAMAEWVRWEVKRKPQGAIQAYVSGELVLWATWRVGKRPVGTVAVEPLGFGFYDSNRAPVGKWRTMVMRKALNLWAEGIRNRDGVRIPFWVTSDDENDVA